MTTPEIEEFAKIPVQKVRDATIQSADVTLRPSVQHPIANRWRDAAGAGTPESFASVLIPDVMDETIFYLLQAIDQGVLQLSFEAPTGKTVDLSTEGLGELSGWYAGHGWREKYAKERFADNFPDLG